MMTRPFQISILLTVMTLLNEEFELEWT